MQATNCYITTTSGMSGYFAILVGKFEDEPEPYYDIISTGIGRYKTKDEAIEEAKQWAEADELEFKER